MGDVAKEGRTVLFVSHNMVAINKLCTEVLWIDKGMLKNVGSTDNVVDLYSRDALSQAMEGRFSESAVRGDGRVKLISYFVTNHLGQPQPLPITNGDMFIRVKLYVDEPISQPACGISISNERGVLMTSINTVEQGASLKGIPSGELEIVVKLGEISFLPGLYIASFWVMNPQGHIYVMAEDSIRFEIGQSSIYGTRHIDYRWGCVYTKVDFLIEQPYFN